MDVRAEDVLAEDVLADARTSVLHVLECDTLIEEVATAFRAGLFARSCQVARTLEPYLEEAGRWADWRSTQELALAAAIRLGDWEAQGRSQLSIGRACLAMGDVERGRAQTNEGTLILRALGAMV